MAAFPTLNPERALVALLVITGGTAGWAGPIGALLLAKLPTPVPRLRLAGCGQHRTSSELIKVPVEQRPTRTAVTWMVLIVLVGLGSTFEILKEIGIPPSLHRGHAYLDGSRSEPFHGYWTRESLDKP